MCLPLTMTLYFILFTKWKVFLIIKKAMHAHSLFKKTKPKKKKKKKSLRNCLEIQNPPKEK